MIFALWCIFAGTRSFLQMHARAQLRQGAVRGRVQELPGVQGVLGE